MVAAVAAAATKPGLRSGRAAGQFAVGLGARARGAAFWLTLAVSSTIAAPARAADDMTVLGTVQQVMSEDYPGAAFGPAQEKLEEAYEKCKRGKCSGATRAQVFVALGMVASQLGKADEAKIDFISALQLDATARLPASGTTPNIRTQWSEAEREAGGSAPAPAAPGPRPDAPTPDAPRPEAPKPAAPPMKIPGWESSEAFQAASAGLSADMAGNLDECIAKDRESLKLEEQPRTRLHLASCERRSGKLIDALRDAQKALEDAIQKRDSAVMRAARDRVQGILPRIPHVTFKPPPGVDDLQVTFDERAVPVESLTKKFSVDPGKHTVHAEGTQGGVPLAFDGEYDVKEAELLTVELTLKSQASEYLTPGQLKCMLSAKSQDEVVKCLPEDRKNLVVRLGLDSSVYTDTSSVNVASPGLSASVTSPTSGWNVGGNFLLDVVTAASPDIVSEASRVFRDKRYAGALSGGYKYKTVSAQASSNLSVESDYVSAGGGIALSLDTADKLVTPRVAYSYSHDTIGRSTTPFSVFSHTLETHGLEGGVTVVLSPRTLLLLSATLQLERGDQSKPYRYVPLFDPAIARRLPVGATVDLVNANRLPLRPIEQLPTERDRYAVGARLAHRLAALGATLRVDERLYVDTWSLKATSTDARFIVDVGRRLRVWPHARLHAQTGTSFYQLAYAAALNADGSISLPLFRTTDRELSPLVSVTAGGGVRYALTSPDAKAQIGVTLQADVMYTRYFNAIFLTQRTAGYGTLGLDAEFD